MCGRQNIFDANGRDGAALGQIGEAGAEDAFERFQHGPVVFRGQVRGALHVGQLLFEPLANHIGLKNTHDKYPDVIGNARTV